MSDIAIRVVDLGKSYRIGRRERYHSLRDTLMRCLRAPFRRSGRNGRTQGDGQDSFWALKDVSFEVPSGQVVGIIGRNGAGKSTLLKILSRITEPSEGMVELQGRVGSLLEVGTGFHPELTGRENVALNGAILGMSRAEIRSRFDEIVAFSGVEEFLDTPVKHYSSGMYMRLAFAVAAHLDPEILVVDEVLAVGDAEFQKKCLGKMGETARSGRTVLLVSHNLGAVQALCSSAILLSGGRLVAKGSTKTIIDQYLAEVACSGVVPLRDRMDREGTGKLRFTEAALTGGNGQDQGAFQCGESASINLRFVNTSGRHLRKVRVAICINNELGQRILELDSFLLGQDLEQVGPGAGQIRVTMPKLPLLPGRYDFNIYSEVDGVVADWIRNAAVLDVEGGDYFGTGRLPSRGEGLFVAEHTIQYQHIDTEY